MTVSAEEEVASNASFELDEALVMEGAEPRLGGP